MIARQTRQLARLVDDLLDVSRITQGKITLRPQNVDLRAIVRQVAQAWKGASSARHQTLDVVLPPEPMPVHADPARLEQVLSNLVSNAVKYTPDGGTIVLRAQLYAGLATVAVSDNGIGIPPDLLMRVFDLARENHLAYPKALRLMLKAILVSPQFLFITPATHADSTPQQHVDRPAWHGQARQCNFQDPH